MDESASFIVLLADIAFFLALIASVVFGIILGYYSLRHEENRILAIVSLSVYVIGCILILLFALSTTNIGV